MSKAPAIRLSELTKNYTVYDRREGVLGGFKDLINRQYKELCAVDRVSFEVAEGEILGYIGPNGAGKSTSIKMLTGILQPTSGEISVCGYHPFRDRKQYTAHIGVVFGQRTQLWWDIAVIESFRLLSRIYEVEEREFKRRLGVLSEVLELDSFIKTPVRKLSLGQRMRCDLAASLLHQPKVLFLDEPTIGLDAVAKDKIRSFLRVVNREFNTTILLTTHDLKEIEELCERIVILDKGKILYDGSINRIKTLPGLKRIVKVDLSETVSLDSFKKQLSDGQVVEVSCLSERRFELSVDPGQLAVADIVRQLLSKFSVSDLSISDPDIEQVIMKMYREGVDVTRVRASAS